MKNFKRIWKYFTDHKLFIFAAFMSSAVVSATDGATAYIVKDILDGIFIAKNERFLILIPIVIVIIFSVRFVARFMQSYFIQYAGLHGVQKIREDLYQKMIQLPMSYYDKNDTGAMMTRIINDVTNLQNAIPDALKIIRSILSIFALIGVVLYQDLELGSTIFLTIPFMIILINKTGKKIKKYSRKQQERIGDLATALQETFSGVQVVKSFASEDKETFRFFGLNAREVKYRLKQVLLTSISSPLMETIAGFAIAIIIFYGGLKVINGETTTGTFFSFITAFGLMFDPFKKINQYNASVQAANASAERIFDVIDTHNAILDKDGTMDCDAHGKDISFENVSFCYSKSDGNVLDGFTLDVKAGMTIALVGSSGAGKSTIASLIPRFYDVTDGSIKIGGTDIRDFKVHSLRENIGTVSQDPFLFNETIAYNIAYGVSDPKTEDIYAAAESAYALKFIEELQDGFDTVIGERGDRLSGGQKQRVTIARALLLNPPILILDEATSSLDAESESIVQKALTNLMKGRTSFVIAHRLSTVLNADMIVVLDKGKIESTGTHQELLEKSEIYSRLCNLQFTDK
ncbi:MAG: ABC transporter ATP-binding protein [Denitrovibrio sp.]|mgnify:CR=1 FL=1|nr:MAG: ABC transporter ATP-binding protein [Denitrovibrio sp.]